MNLLLEKVKNEGKEHPLATAEELTSSDIELLLTKKTQGKEEETAQIIAFGDSITRGLGSVKGGYPSILTQIMNEAVLNRGTTVELTSSGLKRLGTVLEKDPPETVK